MKKSVRSGSETKSETKKDTKKVDSAALSATYFSLDGVKWLLGIALLAGASIGFNYYAAYPFLYRFFALLLALFFALFLFWKTERGRLFIKLMRASRVEISKVIWPTRPEVWQTSLMVSLVALVAAVVFWLADIFFGWLVSLFIG